MKNKITDLNNHLFEQLERLNDEDLKGDELKQEIQRSSAVVRVSNQIINVGRLALDAKKHVDDMGLDGRHLPEILQIEKKTK